MIKIYNSNVMQNYTRILTSLNYIPVFGLLKCHLCGIRIYIFKQRCTYTCMLDETYRYIDVLYYDADYNMVVCSICTLSKKKAVLT